MVPESRQTWNQTTGGGQIQTNIHVGFGSLKDSGIGSGGESVVAKDSVDRVDTSSGRYNVPGSAQERGNRARECHCDA